MAECVLITEKEYHKGEETFRAAKGLDIESVAFDEDMLAKRVLDRACRAVILGVEPYTGPLYEALGKTGGGRGAIIARHGVGHDAVDKALCRKHDIVVTNTPGVLDISVAEHTMWSIGVLAKNFVPMDAEMRRGSFPSPRGMEVKGKKLALIGFGPIGREVAAIAHKGFGMEVLAVDILSAEQLQEQTGKTMAELSSDLGLATYTADANDVLGQADMVSIHLPINDATRHFFNAERFAHMKPGSMLVNTARGPLVDEIALYDALLSGHVAAAALDVFEEEPYVPVSPEKDLRTLANVVLTPHTASNTVESNRRIAAECLRNIAGFFAGDTGSLSRVDIPT